jgi:hypothetical protein
MNRFLIAAAALTVATSASQAQPARIYDNDVVEAYEYMLGRWLVLRQEALDLKEGFKWNEIVHREPGTATDANPDLDLVQSEAWIGVDEASCTMIELPEIKDRYYTVQVLNGWGEVTANINERNFPKHPFGRFALCLKDAKITLPKDPVPRAGRQAKGAPPPPPSIVRPPVLRVDLPNKKSRVTVRIERGEDAAEAVALQKKITMGSIGQPKIEPAVVQPAFTNSKLPGVEAFDKTDDILASEEDINTGMVAVQDTSRAIAKAVADPAERARIDDVIHKRAIPAFLLEVTKIGKPVNGWIRPRVVGNFRTDYLMRTITNFTGIWANNSRETTSFTLPGVEGSQLHTQTFPSDALPDNKARYFWSVIALDTADNRVVVNPRKVFAFDTLSDLKANADGSITLAFAPRLPAGIPGSNWLQTIPGRRFNLTYRFYGPTKDVSDGPYTPPPLLVVKK